MDTWAPSGGHRDQGDGPSGGACPLTPPAERSDRRAAT